MHDRVIRLQREKSDALSLKAQAEEHLGMLQAQLNAKVCMLLVIWGCCCGLLCIDPMCFH